MPSESGRYLFMTRTGTFFVGVWNASERSLHTQAIGFRYDDKDRRVTDGRIYMARWSFRDNGRVFWREPDEPLDCYRIWQRAMPQRRLKAMTKRKAKKTGRDAVIGKIMAKIEETCERVSEELVIQPADLEEIEAMLRKAVK